MQFEGRIEIREVMETGGNREMRMGRTEEENIKRSKDEDELFNRVDNPYRITEPQINACSSMDCTGTVAVAPASKEELEAYLDVYQFESQSCPAAGDFTGGANQESDGMKKLMGIPTEGKGKEDYKSIK